MVGESHLLAATGLFSCPLQYLVVATGCSSGLVEPLFAIISPWGSVHQNPNDKTEDSAIGGGHKGPWTRGQVSLLRRSLESRSGLWVHVFIALRCYNTEINNLSSQRSAWCWDEIDTGTGGSWHLQYAFPQRKTSTKRKENTKYNAIISPAPSTGGKWKRKFPPKLLRVW